MLYFGSDDGYIYAVELPSPRHTMTSPLDSSLLQTYAGNFEFTSGSKITVTLEGGKLFLDFPGAGKTELRPQSESIFAVGDSLAISNSSVRPMVLASRSYFTNPDLM